MHFLWFRLGLCIASALPNAKLNINLGDNHFELSVMYRSIVTLQPPPQGEVVGGGMCRVFTYPMALQCRVNETAFFAPNIQPCYLPGNSRCFTVICMSFSQVFPGIWKDINKYCDIVKMAIVVPEHVLSLFDRLVFECQNFIWCH